jgi:hypothetical protein
VAWTAHNVEVLQDCTATVSELDSCLTVLSDFAHNNVTCDAAGKPPSPPPCFQQISKACPKLFK